MKSKMGLTLGLCALVMTLAAGRAAAANPSPGNPVDGTITVTPVPTLSISVSGNIPLGPVSVAQSTYPASGQALANLSTVGVKVKGQITSGDGVWTTDGTAGYNKYVLKVLAAATVPLAATLDNETALSSSITSPITNAQSMGAASQAGDTTNLWYKLSMPTSVSNTTARTITITYTAEAL